MKFSVGLTDNGVSQTLLADGWKLYRNGSDITSLVAMVDNDGNIVSGTNAIEEDDTFLTLTFTSEEVVAKGSSNVYSLRATLTGYTAGSEDDTITVKLNGDSLADLDNNTAGTQNTLAIAGINANNNFIWSDMSSTSHDPATSADWTNSYQVKNLPFSGKTMTN